MYTKCVDPKLYMVVACIQMCGSYIVIYGGRMYANVVSLSEVIHSSSYLSTLIESCIPVIFICTPPPPSLFPFEILLCCDPIPHKL